MELTNERRSVSGGWTKMVQVKQQGKQNAYMTNLMISLLLRFPEIMSLHFDMPQDEAKFTFLLKGKLEQEYNNFTVLLHDALAAFQDLTGKEFRVKAALQRSGKISLLTLISGTSCLSLEGIQLLCGLVRSSFAAALIRDAEATAVLQDDDLLQQEEMITYLLNHSTGTNKDSLLAFREAGKVYIFDK